MRKTSCYLLAFGILMASCTGSKKEVNTSENPFFSEYTTPHQVPSIRQNQVRALRSCIQEGY